jgi:hypothetical protein
MMDFHRAAGNRQEYPRPGDCYLMISGRKPIRRTVATEKSILKWINRPVSAAKRLARNRPTSIK